MQASRDRYDWIVLGDHPAALLSAALIGKLGLSVLVNPVDPGFRPPISPDGVFLDPELNLIFGVDESGDGVFTRSLRRAGILQQELEFFSVRHKRLSQLIVPNHRFDQIRSFEEVPAVFEAEIGNMNVNDVVQLKVLEERRRSVVDYWTEQFGQLGGWKIGRSRGRISFSHLSFQDHRVQDLLFGLAYDVNGTPFVKNGSFEHMVQVLAISNTPARVKGGMTYLRGILGQMAQQNGAEILPDPLSCRVLTQKNRFKGIEILDSGKRIYGIGCSLGCSPDFIDDHLVRSQNFRLKSSYRGWWFSVALKVAVQGIPERMPERVTWKEGGAPSLYLEIGYPNEYGIADDAHVFLFLRTVVPRDSRLIGFDWLASLSVNMVRKAQTLIPFLENYVVSSFPGLQVDELRSTYPFIEDGIIPSNLKVYTNESSEFESDIRGLFYVGDAAFPELGRIGSLVAALDAFAWASRQ